MLLLPWLQVTPGPDWQTQNSNVQGRDVIKPFPSPEPDYIASSTRCSDAHFIEHTSVWLVAGICRSLVFSYSWIDWGFLIYLFIFFFSYSKCCVADALATSSSDYSFLFFRVRGLLHILPYNLISCFPGNSSAVQMMPFWTAFQFL